VTSLGKRVVALRFGGIGIPMKDFNERFLRCHFHDFLFLNPQGPCFINLVPGSIYLLQNGDFLLGEHQRCVMVLHSHFCNSSEWTGLSHDFW